MMIPTSFFKKNIDSLIAALLGLIIIRLFTVYNGVGISPDSIAYISAARHFATGIGFIDFSGHPMVLFPLFYPFFLGLAMFLTQQDIISIAPWVNALLFGTVIFLSGVIIEQFKYKTNWYKRIMLAIILCSPSLISIFTMLWSETLFVFLTIIFILALYRYLCTHTYRSLIITALVAAIAFDTRYAGITLVGTACLLIFFERKRKWREKMMHIFLFGGISSSLVLLNLIRNYMLFGPVTGMRQKGITPFFKNVEYSGNVLSEWFRFDIKGQFPVILLLAVFVLFLVFFIRNFRHAKYYSGFENIAVAFFIVYVLFIIVSSTLSRYETINNRLLVPAFIPFLWISTCQLPKWRNTLSHPILQWVFFIFSVGIAGALVVEYMSVNQENYSYMTETGVPGYSEDEWTKSHIVQYIKHHDELLKSRNTIYSNHGHAVYFYTGHTTQQLPERVYKEEVNRFMQTDSALLVWFGLYGNKELINMEEVVRLKDTTLVKKLPDGAIYFIRNKRK